QAQSAPDEPDLVELDADRRARLVAFIEANNRMPADAKERLLGQLSQPMVPARMVARIESRMGG
ncbi:MAG: efflux transporter periplasmic adaptor subunit, partial [Pseudomonadota bacterium]